MEKKPIRVVFCWHMHQPYYQDQADRQYRLPWVYLHAIKDYTDMANILESIPQAKAVINFCPILLEQISDYDWQIHEFLEGNRPLNDPLLALLCANTLPSSSEQRQSVIDQCLRANEHRLIKAHKSFSGLVDLATRVQQDDLPLTYLNEQYFFDLLVWYHLAWLGETVRRNDTRVAALVKKQCNYNYNDRRLLLKIIGELLRAITPKYKNLADAGQVELSVTPYSHTMMPLLLDMDSARDSEPEIHLPPNQYPGGRERVEWQLSKAIEVFENHFDRKPLGCWPSEGGLSEAVLQILGESGFAWTASGSNVLLNSINGSREHRNTSVHRPYHCKDYPVSCFFRDDKLSDLIGFNYSDWHGDDAANNLVEHLQTIHELPDGDEQSENDREKVVSIILDGENCWEYYPNNGFYFLTALYRSLVKHPDIRMSTFSECIDENIPAAQLDKLVAGSWVYGSFSTWIGDPDKNRAWELLCTAKKQVDRITRESRLAQSDLASIEKQLAICEGSDWFWWFGDYNPGSAVKDFDELYRLHLSHLYILLGLSVPEELAEVISVGAAVEGTEKADAVELGGVMRRGEAS